jgi:hypothetical protein
MSHFQMQIFQETTEKTLEHRLALRLKALKAQTTLAESSGNANCQLIFSKN